MAGLFYPEDARALRRTVCDYLAGEPTLPDPGPLGLICPHAGYSFSGPTAGRAYRELRSRPPQTVIVLAPSHRDRFPGATAWPGAGYRTPLGDLPSPAWLVELLEHEDVGIHQNRLGHRDEHSAEVQLPFLQEIAPAAEVLSLVLADDRSESCFRIGRAIARTTTGRRILLVASSDLCHGHSNRICEETDARTLAALERNDPEELVAGFRNGTFQACGHGPILAALEACRQLGAETVRVLERTNSDRVTGEAGDYVVGYAAVSITRA